MGQIKTKVKIKNIFNQNELEIEALVDTGAMYMSLPKDLIAKLELKESRKVRVRTTNGVTYRKVYQAGEISINDRFVNMDILELSNEVPPLVGVLILKALDFIVDPIQQKLLPNPEHNGEYLIDCFYTN